MMGDFSFHLDDNERRLGSMRRGGEGLLDGQERYEEALNDLM